MGVELFEVGLNKATAKSNETVDVPAGMGCSTDPEGSAMVAPPESRSYIRLKSEHDLSVVDDLAANTVLAMKQAGFSPAVVVETSPGNYQA
jgi:hypothetical protein